MGLARCLSLENPQYRFTTIDLECDSSTPSNCNDQFDIAVRCLTQCESVVAIRRNTVWIPRLTDEKLPEVSTKNFAPQRNGRYLITGGFGALGRVLAEDLVNRGPVGLALVGRKPVDTERARFAETLIAKGAHVICETADVADKASLNAALDRIEHQLGGLDAIFHLAAAPGTGLVQLKHPEEALAVMRPKARGFAVLLDAIEKRNVPHVIAFSSIIAHTGLLGEADYAAANAFLDAHARAGCDFTHLLTVSWGAWRLDPWRETLAGVDAITRDQLSAVRERYGLDTSQALQMLWLLWSAGWNAAVVAAEPPDLSFKRFNDLLTASLSVRQHSAQNNPKTRPALSTVFSAPRDDTERSIAAIWQDAFGLAEIGRDDDFFELGGQSLLALQTVDRISRALNVDLPKSILFECPSIAMLAMRIHSNNSNRAPEIGSGRGVLRRTSHKTRTRGNNA
jgi:hypothetical protein